MKFWISRKGRLARNSEALILQQCDQIPARLESLEDRLLLSGSEGIDFTLVDNTSQLSGYTTTDLVAPTTDYWDTATLRVKLTKGEIYQDPAGLDMAPPHTLKDYHPTSEFDTYTGSIDMYYGDLRDGYIGLTGGPGNPYYKFDSEQINVAFDAFYYYYGSDHIDIARITLSDDAEGTWSVRLNRSRRDITWFDIGSIKDGNFISNRPPESAPPQAVKGDFTGDGWTDMLWHNTQTGENELWQITWDQQHDPIRLRRLRDIDWELVGTGDFTGDGKNDILWRNSEDGRNAVWEMDGTDFVASHLLQDLRAKAWHIAGVGDFTGDGKQDILWRNSQDGRNAVWEMDGTNLTASHMIQDLAFQQWQVGGVDDFNGDGIQDILWRNSRTGLNSVWEMDRLNYKQRSDISALGETGWSYSETASYGDYKFQSDVNIIRENYTGNYVDLTLRDDSQTDSWQIAGVFKSEFNSRTNILWRSTTSDRSMLWIMQDKMVLDAETPWLMERDPAWQPAGSSALR